MVFDDRSPIYLQIAEQIKNDIVTGALAEDEQVMSTNQYAAFYRINPATAAKGFAQLVDDGVLYKKRGIGMFVSAERPRPAPHRPPRLVLRRRRRPDDPRGQGDRRPAERHPPAHPNVRRSLMTAALTVRTEDLSSGSPVCPRWTGSICVSRPERSTACSAGTGPARARSPRRWPGSGGPTRGGC